jgi:hypothetical protein
MCVDKLLLSHTPFAEAPEKSGMLQVYAAAQ